MRTYGLSRCKSTSAPGQVEVAGKRNLLFDPRVDVFIDIIASGAILAISMIKRCNFSRETLAQTNLPDFDQQMDGTMAHR